MSTYSIDFTYSDKIMEDNSLYDNYLQMDLILKKLFTLKNPKPIIDFLNAIYGDGISYNAKISFSDKEIINKKRNSIRLISFYADMYITVTDENEIYEYAMEFQTIFDTEIAVRIFRYNFERAIRIADYTHAKKIIKLKMPEPLLILLEETSDIGDSIKLQMEFSKGQSFIYDIKVLKYWTYDLKKLYKDNMYLLYPLQIFKLRKRMQKIFHSKISANLKEEEMLKLYHEMRNLIKKTLEAIDKAYTDGRIELGDYDEMSTVIENINSYFINYYDKYSEFELEVQEMVKSFYDPRIEEKGIEKGIEKGKIEGKIEGKIDILLKLLAKKFGEVPGSYIERLKKLPEDVIDKVNLDVLEIKEIKEIEKYF